MAALVAPSWSIVPLRPCAFAQTKVATGDTVVEAVVGRCESERVRVVFELISHLAHLRISHACLRLFPLAAASPCIIAWSWTHLKAARSLSFIPSPHSSTDSMSGLTYGAYGATTALTVVGLCKSWDMQRNKEAAANGGLQTCS